MDTAAVDLLPFLSPQQVADQLGRADAPLIFDARKTPAFDAASRVIPCALRLLPDDVSGIVSRLTRERRVVVYCVHGHAVSQGAARSLRDGGIHACYLEGGVTAWEQAGLPTIAKLPECGLPAAPGRASRWSTRERPKIDRIACPWPIRRFIDPTAEFLYVPAGQVIKVGQAQHAIPYDVPDVRFSHRGAAGELCSFDAFIADFGLNDPCLHDLARIVRGADTGKPALTAQSSGHSGIHRVSDRGTSGRLRGSSGHVPSLLPVHDHSSAVFQKVRQTSWNHCFCRWRYRRCNRSYYRRSDRSGQAFIVRYSYSAAGNRNGIASFEIQETAGARDCCGGGRLGSGGLSIASRMRIMRPSIDPSPRAVSRGRFMESVVS